MRAGRLSLFAPMVALLLIAGACFSPAADRGSPRLIDLPTPGTAPPPAIVASDPTLLSSTQLELVYGLILQRFIDPVDHAHLLAVAYQSMREALLQSGALPTDTAIVDLAPTVRDDPEADWLAFARSYDALIQKYPDWAMELRLDHQIITRMVQTLDDRHSVFTPPEDARRRRETDYSGIGVRLARPAEGQPPRVMEVFPDTPASQQGVRAGDRILAVDGEPIAHLPLSTIVDLIRGPEGTAVTLELERAGTTAPLRLSIARQAVEIRLVEGSMVDGVGYVRIRSFTEGVASLVGTAVVEFERRDARGWIIDLRGNGGGRLTAVQTIAGMFVDDMPIGIEVNRAGERASLESRGPQIVGNAPVLVLIDSDSASGAEILAAALKEYRQAIIVGEASAGNVAVAEEIPLPDGSVLQLTVRRFLGPRGDQLDRVGIQPDIPVQITDEDLVAGRDPQLGRALEAIRALAPGRV